MKHNKILNLFLAVTLAVSMLTGCGDSNTTPSEKASQKEATENVSEATESNATDDETTAKQLLNDLTGSYQELWPVILDDKFEQIWLDNCKELVGEDNAEAAYNKLAMPFS